MLGAGLADKARSFRFVAFGVFHSFLPGKSRSEAILRGSGGAPF